MTEEDAALQMELVGHSFFVYRDADTGGVCVLYRRRDGDYGVIEVE
jgi:putative sigma-54 modulation protein